MQKFLDDTGLAYFWNEVKARIDETSSGSGPGGIINWEDINNRPDLSTVSNMKAVQITLLADGWENNEQELPVAGVSEDIIKQLIIIVPDKDDSDNFYAAGITAMQGENAITFNAVNSPTEDMGLYIYIIESVETKNITNFEWWSPHMTSDTTPEPYAAKCSSVQQGSAYIAFDGLTGTENNYNNFWHSLNSIGQWISFDFGKKTYINGIRIFPISTIHGASRWRSLPKKVIIYGSDNGSTWDIIYSNTFSDEDIQPNEYKEYMFESAEYYRYFKIENLQSFNNDYYFVCTEIEFSVLGGKP